MTQKVGTTSAATPCQFLCPRCPRSRGCPTAAVGAAVPWHIPSGLAAQPGMGSSPPSTAPALPPFLHWTKLHLLGHFWSNSCQQGKNRDFLPIYCIKLAFQADILEHTHCNMLRENCFAPSNSWHWCSDGDAALPHLIRVMNMALQPKEEFWLAAVCTRVIASIQD